MEISIYFAICYSVTKLGLFFSQLGARSRAAENEWACCFVYITGCSVAVKSPNVIKIKIIRQLKNRYIRMQTDYLFKSYS